MSLQRIRGHGEGAPKSIPLSNHNNFDVCQVHMSPLDISVLLFQNVTFPAVHSSSEDGDNSF